MKTITLGALVALSFAVAGCATSGTPHITIPFRGQVTWVLYPGPTSLQAAFKQAGGSVAFDLNLVAFAQWRGAIDKGGTCTIHTMFPGAYDTLAEFGAVLDHEIRHCREGQFHP